MSKKSKLSPIATAVGVSVVAALAGMPLANAASNPFAASDLGAGYMKVAEGNCGGMKGKEGKCGADKKGKKDGSCGGMKDKKDGKCGGKKGKEGTCGEGKKMEKEGKCGEGKCGGKK